MGVGVMDSTEIINDLARRIIFALSSDQYRDWPEQTKQDRRAIGNRYLELKGHMSFTASEENAKFEFVQRVLRENWPVSTPLEEMEQRANEATKFPGDDRGC